jgi:thiol-disulfide isomerase/thioredoxin
MALTESNSFEIGILAPDFFLVDTISNAVLDLNFCKGKKGTVIFFICNHCPFVLHVNEQLVALANDYLEKGIGFVAISSNDVVNYPQDAPDLMKEVAKKLQYPFPYLYDEDQKIAKAYNAACTPDFYIFDSDLKSIYHGQLDDSRPGNSIPVSGKSIREILDNLLHQNIISAIQKPSIGCGIKWKKEEL